MTRAPSSPEVEVLASPAELEAALRDPAAWPVPVQGPVQVVHTHISLVFLAGEHVFKLKKPLLLPFLDASTLARRRELCEAEVTLNARLAPGVYLGVLPVVRERGGLRLGGRGPAVEWAVHMRRLPPERSLLAMLERGEVDAPLMRRLGARIAAFHASARRGPGPGRWATWPAVSSLLRENLDELGGLPEPVAGPALLAGLARRTEDELARQRALIEDRSRRGLAVDGHGDLRLEHVYFACQERPDEPLVIDCVEFSDKLRCGDPAVDVAFLVMELERAGRADLGRELADAAFARDPEAQRLLPLYVSYRAAVRAKVDGITAGSPGLPAAQRVRCRRRGLSEALLALGRLSPPAARPCLVLLAGLPGTGKSVLARALLEPGGFTWIRSDEVRKQLAGLSAASSARGAADQGLYTPEWGARTYAACLERAEAVLQDGGRPLVDANFPDEERRQAFLTAAAALGVPARLLLLETSPELARARIAARRGDASDADPAIYEALRARFQPLSPGTLRCADRIDAGGSPQATLQRATAALRAAGLL